MLFRVPPSTGPSAGPSADPDAGPGRGSVEGAVPVSWGEDDAARLRVREVAGGERWEVLGEVDLASAGRLQTALLDRLAAVPTGTPVTLDLGRTSYLASAGVGTLLQVLTAARERQVPLAVRAAAGSAPARILALAGLSRSLADGARGNDPP